MNTTFKMAALPVLLAVVALVLWQAGLVFADDPGEGEPSHTHAGYPAPAVTLAGHSVCSTHVSRSVVLARFQAVGDSRDYEQQIAWSHDPALSGDNIPWGQVHRNTRTGPKPWALRIYEPDIGKGHSLRVRALDSDGNHGPWGEATYVYVVGQAAPPVDLAVSAVDGDYSRAVLRWQDGSDGAINGFRFRIQHRASGAGGWHESDWTTVEKWGSGEDIAYQHVLTGLDPSVAHDFRVAAQTRECTPTDWSSSVSLSPPAPPPAPDFTALVSYGGSGASLVVTPQNPPAGVTSYTLRYRVKGSGGEYTEMTATAAAAASGITVPGLSHGKTYEVGLRASNAVGDGAYADREVTVSGLPDPPGFTVSADYREDGVSLLVDLTKDVAGATGYVVKVDGSSTTHVPSAFDGNGVSRPAAFGTAYSVSVATVSAVGQGAFSAVQSFTTLSLPSLSSATALVQYSGDSASILVTVPAAPASEELQGYLVRYRKSSSEEAEWSAMFVSPGVAQAGHSISVELGASYDVEVSGLNQAGEGPVASLAVSVKAKPDAPDFTAEAVYSGGSATVLVKVKPAGSGVLDYSVRYRASATDSWTVSSITVAKAQAGWSFTAEPGASYSVGVAARTEVGLGSYGTASVSIVSRVAAPEFTVAFTRTQDGASARVAVGNLQPQAQYHMFTMDGSTPVKAEMPDVEHDFDVVLGTTYRFGVAAGNQLGTGDYAYRNVTALVVPDAPSFTLVPVYQDGEARLEVQVSGPDPHASHYLLKVGSAVAVRHTSLADLHLPVTPGESYTVSLAVGNAAGDSAFSTVTRSTTVAEYEALLEWRLIVPEEHLPAGVVGDPTQYVAIVNGDPVVYDPVGPCIGREVAGVGAESSRAQALYSWVSGMSGAPATLTAYALSHRDQTASALAAAEVEARTACQARHPAVENLELSDARWVRVPR